MKNPLCLAVAFLSSHIAGSTIPSLSSLHSNAKDILTVAGTTDPHHVAIHFRAPCPGCSVESNAGLELAFEIDSADNECTSNPPRLNGLPLAITNGKDATSGVIAIKPASSTDAADQPQIHAVWETTCLQGEASILSVQFVNVVGGKPLNDRSGFTTSYSQKGQPTVLRLQDKPLTNINSDDICDEWLRPDDSHRLAVAPLPLNRDILDQLFDVQYKSLNALKAKLEHLSEHFPEAEDAIMSLFSQDFSSCSSIKCLWKATKSKIMSLCKLLMSHFSHSQEPMSGCSGAHVQTACQSGKAAAFTNVDSQDSAIDSTLKTVSPDPTSTPIPLSHLVPTLPTRSVDQVKDASTPTATPSNKLDDTEDVNGRPHEHLPDEDSSDPSPPGPPWGYHGPPPWARPHNGGGPPPWFKPHDGNGPPPGHPGPPPWARPHNGGGPPPWFKPHDGNGPPPGHHGPPPWFRPHGGDGSGSRQHDHPPWFRPDGEVSRQSEGSAFDFSGPRRFLDHHLALAVAALILLVVIGAASFTCVRIMRDPRRRAERAAWREERRTKRLYRKAAYKHRWNTWWNRYRRLASGECEEKTETNTTGDTRSDNILRRQLRSLRDATDLVRGLLAAEEGRAQPPCPTDSTEYRPTHHLPDYATEDADSVSSERPPSYLPPPPQYVQELEGELTVVDGLVYTTSLSGYTPSNFDDATESSIVDCSPRLSCETGRSTILTRDTQDL